MEKYEAMNKVIKRRMIRMSKKQNYSRNNRKSKNILASPYPNQFSAIWAQIIDVIYHID